LTLWFDYGQWPEVHEALIDGIKSIKIDEWLQVGVYSFLKLIYYKKIKKIKNSPGKNVLIPQYTVKSAIYEELIRTMKIFLL